MNCQENEKVAFSSKETYDFQVLGNNTLKIAGYIPTLVIKLWLRKDDDLQKLPFDIHPNLFIQ